MRLEVDKKDFFDGLLVLGFNFIESFNENFLYNIFLSICTY